MTDQISNDATKSEPLFSVIDLSPSMILDRQLLIISKRLKTLENLLRWLSEDPLNDQPVYQQRSNWFYNVKQLLTVSPYWECNSLYCDNCEFCCKTALKMYLDCHVLNERDNVGENYIAIWRIMYKIIHKKYIEQQMAFLKAQAAAKQEEVDSFPDDLQELIGDWEKLPENKAGCQLTQLSDDTIRSVVAGLTEVAPKTTASSTVLTTQQKDRALLFSRPIKVINPQQIKLTAQGLSNLKSINVRLGRVLPVKLTQKRSILQNRTNLPLVENNPGKKVTVGRGVKRDPTSTLIVPRFSSLLARANPTLITPLAAHVNQARVGRPSPLVTPATSLLAANNAVSMHREFPPRQVPTHLKVAFIQCTPKKSESSGDVVGDDDSRKS